MLGECLGNIQTCHKELEEHENAIENIKNKQLEIEKVINTINNYWIMRAWRKISDWLSKK